MTKTLFDNIEQKIKPKKRGNPYHAKGRFSTKENSLIEQLKKERKLKNWYKERYEILLKRL